jgi:hypothetical protein
MGASVTAGEGARRGEGRITRASTGASQFHRSGLAMVFAERV